MTQQEKRDHIVFILSDISDDVDEQNNAFCFHPEKGDPYWRGFIPTKFHSIPLALSEAWYLGDDDSLTFIFVGGEGVCWEHMSESSQDMMYEKFLGIESADI